MAAQLTQGQTEVLGVDDIIVSVRHQEAIDLSAFLLTSEGRVRGIDDLIFYNQPTGQGVRLLPDRPNAAAIALREIPSEIDHVRLVVSLDDQLAQLGDYPAPEVSIADAEGNILYEYVIEELGAESTVVVLDLDRSDLAWQIRAQGQGYRSGFAALATGHGVAIDNPPVTAPETPPNGFAHPAASELPELALGGSYTPELVAGQDVALRKEGGAELTLVNMALGWDPIKIRGPHGSRDVDIDLDASALLFSGRQLVDAAFYGQLSSQDGSVRHQGDHLTGEGKGDNEVIVVHLTDLPQRVTAVVFVVTSYAGHTFQRVRNAFWRLVDGTSKAELVRGNLRAGGAHTGMVVAKVYRAGAAWKLQAIGEPIQAGHLVEAAPQVTRFL
ncbi:TerD family protein [Nocardia sp. KC 131]|uniref:TerD family protein n=1 Tax=Nocardia arseniciresistens TaxID=3392119 RepID=UPI00398EC252